MEIGSLTSRVRIMRRVAGQDAIGQPVSLWVEHVAVWASIRQKSGAEVIRADREAGEVQASIRIRKRAELDSSMRVLHGATTYEVQAVMHDEVQREYTDLVCRIAERAADV